jgi:hypothetical protein
MVTENCNGNDGTIFRYCCLLLCFQCFDHIFSESEKVEVEKVKKCKALESSGVSALSTE